MADNPLYPVLARLASALGITIDHLWSQMVLITFYQSLFWSIADPIILFVWTAVTWWYGKYTLKCMEDTTADSTPQAIITAILGITWFIAFWVILLDYPDQLAGVFAPEGVTATHLLKQLAGK